MSFKPYRETVCVDMDLCFQNFMSELASVGLGNGGALAESAIRAIAGRQRAIAGRQRAIAGRQRVNVT